MADAFAPQMSSEVRFNQPIETQAAPSGLGALADLASGFAKAFGNAREDAKASVPKTDPNLQVFQQGLERVEAIRQERGESAAQIAERQLAKNFAAAGIRLGPEFEDTYVTTTGRPWQGYGMDVEATMMQETLKDPKVQALYVASFAVNKDWSEQQRIEYAVGQQAQMTAMENEIARSKTEAGYKWSTQSEAAYQGAVDTFVNTTFGALAASASQGVSVGPQEIANLQAQWAQMKFQLTRPSGVSDDQWKATQDKITAVDNAFASFEKASSNEVLASEIASSFARTMLAEGGGSTESALAALTALKDPATLTNLMGGNVETFIMDIGKNISIGVTTPDLFGHIVSDQGTLANPDPNASLTTLPASVKERIDGKSPEQILAGLEASGQLTGVVKGADLNRPEARQQFTENAATIGAVLMNNKENEFLSADFIKKLVGNPQFVANVKALDNIDPESAAVARTYVRSGLNTEKARQQRNLEAIESNLGVSWSGSTYVLDSQALMTKNGWTREQADGFVAWVGKTYGGDLKKLANGLVPMPEGMPFQPAGLNQAFERRNAIGVIDQTMKALEVPVEAPQGTTNQQTQRTAAIVSVVNAGKGFTEIRLEDGTIERREGTRAWRNNNPGNIEYGDFAKSAGAVGTDGRFAVFPTYEQGREAKKRLLWETRGYAGLTISQAINRYAPPVENDTNAYVNSVASSIGVSPDTPMSSLSDSQKEVMLDAMERVEGFKPGTVNGAQATAAARREVNTPRPNDVNAVAAQSGAAMQRAVENTPASSSVPMTPPAEAAPVAPVTSMAPPAEAALPEQFAPERPSQATQEEAARNAPPVDQEVAALIQEIAGNPDKTFASERELLAAQQRGELEPGDTIIVDGVAYMVRKDGTPKRLGVVQQ